MPLNPLVGTLGSITTLVAPAGSAAAAMGTLLVGLLLLSTLALLLADRPRPS